MKLKDLLLEISSVSKLKQKLKSFIFDRIYDRENYQNRKVDSEVMSYQEWKEYMWDGLRKKESESRFQITLKKGDVKKSFELKQLPSRREYRDKIKNHFDHLVQDVGWFVNKVVISGKSTTKSFVQIQFEKFKSEPVDVPSKLYHVTLKSNLDNIMKNGLVPKSGEKKNFLYPERVFLFTKRNEELFQRFLVNKFSYHMSPQELTHSEINVPPSVVLEVGVDKLGGDIKFYEDNDIPNGVWTNESIPPENIDVIDYIYD